MPEGGDHVPSALRAIRMPEPPEPDIHKPERMHEKIARPTASWTTRGGIFFFATAVDAVGEAGGMSLERRDGNRVDERLVILARLVGLVGVESVDSSRKPSAGSVRRNEMTKGGDGPYCRRI